VDIVVVPGEDGEMGILQNHAPLLSNLNLGVIKVRQGNQEEIFTVTGGVVEVQPQIVTILADAAENVEDIDLARAEAAKKRAEERLENMPSEEDVDRYLAIEAAIRRSSLRLDAARKYRHGRARVPQAEGRRSGQGEDN
jgi:F-type H+-transporting ATPase subunit epsilon